MAGEESGGSGVPVDERLDEDASTARVCMEGTPAVRIKILKPFRSYSTGTVLDVPGGQAAEMIHWGYAAEEKQQQLLETATAESEVRTADARPAKRGRKRA